MKGTILFDLHDEWNDGVKAGDVVYRFDGYTYGCISPGGIAVTMEPDKHPFFEVPAISVVWEGQPVPGRSSGPMRLENWTFLEDHYCGEVYGNPKFVDGTVIHTSRVKDVSGNKVTTQNSVYLLGTARV